MEFGATASWVSLGICGRPPSFILNIQWGAPGHLTRVKETFSGDIFGVPLRPDLSFTLSQILFLVSADELGFTEPDPVEVWGETHRAPVTGWKRSRAETISG